MFGVIRRLDSESDRCISLAEINLAALHVITRASCFNDASITDILDCLISASLKHRFNDTCNRAARDLRLVLRNASIHRLIFTHKTRRDLWTALMHAWRLWIIAASTRRTPDLLLFRLANRRRPEANGFSRNDE